MFLNTQSIKQQIINKLQQELSPTFLEVIDESYMHEKHFDAAKGGETHFKVRISSSCLNNITRVASHRIINKILVDELSNGVHALSIEII